MCGKGFFLRLVPKTHRGRRLLALALLILLNFVAERLNAPDWVFVLLIAALVTLVVWTLVRMKFEGADRER